MDDKKSERKKRRFTARLNKSKGINVVDTPTPNVILCNGGQATGFDKQNISDLIEQHSLTIEPPKYIAEKGETYSYLVFQNSQEALAFYEACNGKVIAKDSEFVYLGFVEKVPDTEILCPHKDPNGLTILTDFITKDEEQMFLDTFDWTDSNLKNRQVKHYGYEFRYGSNDVDLSNPLDEKIPDVCKVLWRRLEEHGFSLGVPDQLTVNKYSPGQGIPSHVDRHSPFGPTILSLSLCAPVVMEWKHHTGKMVPVVLPERSLMVMQEEARYDWQHGIQPRTFDPIIKVDTTNGVTHKVITSDTVERQTRISLTFRWTRAGPCECSYRTLCDVGGNELDDNLASVLEDLHVHQVYEQIAGHFSSTRHTPWPRVVEFLKEVPPGHVIVDLGAGNGKNVQHRTDVIQLACERSSGLLSECRARTAGGGAAADCIRLDALYAPLRERCADTVICIAVIHHFTTKARRLRALSTIHSILRGSGTALITVWARDQTKANYLARDRLPTGNEVVTVRGVTLPVHENRTQFQHQDLLVPWKLRRCRDNKLEEKSESTLLRYYHVFEEHELEALCREAGLVVRSSFYEEGNWCVICKKM